MPRVLVVDDEQTLVQAIAYNLRKEGYEVATAGDGPSALTAARTQPPDLVILDVMLPGLSGIDVCRTLRGESTVPILMLTARAQEVDRVIGLEIGADDYIVKPVGLRELLARVKAALRRSQMLPSEAQQAETGQVIEAGQLRIDTGRHEAWWNGKMVLLRPKEFDLLVYMARHRDQVLSRGVLLTGVWGYDYVGEPRTVDVHVRWLREKLEADPGHPRHLLTVRGNGYKLSL